MRNLLYRLALALLPIILATGATAFQKKRSPQLIGIVSSTPITSTDFRAVIERSARYLELACRSNGMFAYEVDIESGRESIEYNVVRHAGAIYALAMFNHSHPNPKVLQAMVRAAKFLRTGYIGLDSRSNALAVWSRPLPAKSDADLGAAGLGLVALTEVQRAQLNTFPLENLQSLGQFILSLQKPDGSFFDKYRADSGPVGDWQSLYYPGEAALGLISLYELDHSRQWLVAAGRALSFLARSRAKQTNLPPDHWALIATARFLPYYSIDVSPASRAELIQHASRISLSFLPHQIDRGDPALDGAFDMRGRTTPTATRMEGLLAALEFLPDDGTGLRQGIEISVQHGIAFLLRAQIAYGPYAGGMPAVIPRTYPAATKNDPLASEVRIDYVQHALSAWLRYEALLASTERNSRN